MIEVAFELIAGFVLFVLGTIGLGIAAFVTRKHEKNMTNHHFKVKLPVFDFLKWVFVSFLSVLFLIFFVWSLRNSDHRVGYIVGIVICSLALFWGLEAIIAYFRWEMEVIEDTIYVRPHRKSAKRSKTFRFCIITRAEIEIRNKDTVILFSENEELFSICKSSRGYSFFESRLKEEGIPIIEVNNRTKKSNGKKDTLVEPIQEEEGKMMTLEYKKDSDDMPNIQISGFGCFKVDVDPRKPQDVRTRDDLYFFLEGTLKVSGALLVFNHLLHRPGDRIHEIEIKEIRDFKWHFYDKNRHEVFGQEIRFLVPKVFRRAWREVGYFWLPGGRSTEMECTITEQTGKESYLYFRGTPENLKAIEKMREYIQKVRFQRI